MAIATQTSHTIKYCIQPNQSSWSDLVGNKLYTFKYIEQETHASIEIALHSLPTAILTK